MTANYNQCATKPMEEMVWWAILLSNFVSGFLLAIIFSWTNTTGWMAVVKIAGIVAFLMIASFDLSMYSMSTMFGSLSVVFMDIIISTVFTVIIGAVIGLVMGMGKKEV
jgi:hypothetical protein